MKGGRPGRTIVFNFYDKQRYKRGPYDTRIIAFLPKGGGGIAAGLLIGFKIRWSKVKVNIFTAIFKTIFLEHYPNLYSVCQKRADFKS